MITRDEAIVLVNDHVENPRLINHMLAVEAVMIGLAEKLNTDVLLWGLTGLLHDLDVSTTADKPEIHAYRTCEMLEGKLPDEALNAIIVHPGHRDPQTMLDKALRCADPVTGLIIAAAMMHPSKSLNGLPLKSLKKRFKDKRFAAGADRDQMRMCEELEIPLGDFLSLSLTSMQNISYDLGM